MTSPNAGRWPIGGSTPRGVNALAIPPRAQYDAPSYPPLPASGPRVPCPVPRT